MANIHALEDFVHHDVISLVLICDIHLSIAAPYHHSLAMCVS